MSETTTGVLIGRFQPFHDGHAACVRHILDSCGRALILVRSGERDSSNPFTYEERIEQIRAKFPDWEQVLIQPIHDRHNELRVFIGRDVGYELIKLDQATEGIHATDIRRALYEGEGEGSHS